MNVPQKLMTYFYFSSDMVQFRAMVTPCMPTCPPVTCDVLDYTGQSRQVESYGRKKRSEQNIAGYKSTLLEAADAVLNRVKRQADPSEVLVVQTLRIFFVVSCISKDRVI